MVTSNKESSSPKNGNKNDTHEQKTKDVLRKVFNEIDTDHSGFIEYKELKSVMADRFSRQDLDGAWLSLLAVDENHDNRVSFPEFERAFHPLVERQLRDKPKWKFWEKQNKIDVDDTSVMLDKLLNEWQGMAQNLDIGNDLSMYHVHSTEATRYPSLEVCSRRSGIRSDWTNNHSAIGKGRPHATSFWKQL